MNRLTIRNSDGTVSQPTHSTFENVFNRLAEYEDMEEQGLLVRLPCKVGDTIYRCGDPIKKIYEWQIAYVEVYEDETVFVDDSDNTFVEADIGKTVFLTREEAEKALEGNNG